MIVNVINNMASNLGFDVENVLLLLIVLGSVLFFAKDERSGLIMLFISSALCVMWFYARGWYYGYAVIISLVALALLSISLYVNKNTPGYGGVY